MYTLTRKKEEQEGSRGMGKLLRNDLHDAAAYMGSYMRHRFSLLRRTIFLSWAITYIPLRMFVSSKPFNYFSEKLEILGKVTHEPQRWGICRKQLNGIFHYLAFFDPFNCIIAFYDDDIFFVQQEIAYCDGHGAQRFHVEIDRLN